MKYLIFILGALCVQSLAIDLPAQLDKKKGMVALSDQENYTPKTLFDYINGGAEVYTDAGATLCAVRKYGLSNKKEQLAEVACYVMDNDLQAFGLFRQFHYNKKSVTGIGTEAAIDGRMVPFWKGRYYVETKDHSSNQVDPKKLQELARLLAGELEGNIGLPSQISLLPQKGKKSGTERYSEKGFLARSFFAGVLSAEYENACTLFVMKTENGQKAKGILKQIGASFNSDSRSKDETVISERIMAVINTETIIGVVGPCSREEKVTLSELCKDSLK